MRILHVVEATIAGVRTHVQSIATGLDQQQFQQVVVCPPKRENSFGDEQFVTYLKHAGVAVVPIAMRREIHFPSDAAAVTQLVRFLRRKRFDVVHLHSSKAGVIGRLAARIAGHSAVVYSPHGLFFLGDHSPRKRRFYQGIERAAAHLCDRVIAVSPSERDVLLHHQIAPAAKIACIDPGIDPNPLASTFQRTMQRRALGLPLDAPVVGTVARVSAQKNPTLFVEAAARVLVHQPNAVFVWCGDGELRAETEALAHTLGIAAQCRFLGHREDAAAVLATFDVFWLCSNYESFGLATAEAMALERPVVATDVVGTRDVVLDGVTGRLVPPRDPEAFARATLGLLRDPERAAAWGRAGRVRVLERFTESHMLEAIADIYRTLRPVASEVHALL